MAEGPCDGTSLLDGRLERADDDLDPFPFDDPFDFEDLEADDVLLPLPFPDPLDPGLFEDFCSKRKFSLRMSSSVVAFFSSTISCSVRSKEFVCGRLIPKGCDLDDLTDFADFTWVGCADVEGAAVLLDFFEEDFMDVEIMDLSDDDFDSFFLYCIMSFRFRWASSMG